MASDKSRAREAAKKSKSTASKNASTKTPPPPLLYKSAEFVQDSDSNEEEEQDTSSNQVSEDDKNPSSAKSFKNASKVNGKLPAPAGSSSSSEGESGSSDENSDDDESSGDVSKRAPIAVEPAKQHAKDSGRRTVTFTAPPPYLPPTGFDPASLDGSSNASQLLKKSNLEGKHIWYFTAPASVPISSIQTMSLSDVKNGEAILSYKDKDYGFVRKSTEDKTYTKIMIPSGADDGYKYVPKSIDRIFHLQQVVRDPTIANPSKATIPARKPVRQQPTGLRMRFRPIGFGSGKIGKIGSSSPSASDVEMEERASMPIRRALNANELAGDLSSSDQDMEDAPSLAAILPPKDKSNKSSKKVSSLKRKHNEGGEKKSKHSRPSTRVKW